MFVTKSMIPWYAHPDSHLVLDFLGSGWTGCLVRDDSPSVFCCRPVSCLTIRFLSSCGQRACHVLGLMSRTAHSFCCVLSRAACKNSCKKEGLSSDGHVLGSLAGRRLRFVVFFFFLETVHMILYQICWTGRKASLHYFAKGLFAFSAPTLRLSDPASQPSAPENDEPVTYGRHRDDHSSV